MGLPRGAALLACLLAALAPRPGLALEILQVSLEGGTDAYLEVGARVDYALNCDYRTPYDDPVKEVLWARFGRPLYKWIATGSPTVLDSAFLGLVDTAPAQDPHNLHFKAPLHYTLAGTYVCQVFTAAASANASYTLSVVDGGSWPVTMTVQALSKVKQEDASANSSSSSDGNVSGGRDQDKYEADQLGGNDGDTEVAFENEDCTLVWSLSTPAIYPRPNVTCGHYSFDHEDVVQRLPAGLTLHKYPNGSWTAAFDRTHIQVSSLPKNHRLGCSIRIPRTSYKKVIRPQDDLWVESLIDTGGCPGFEHAREMGVIVEIKEATYTCRGDVLPADRTGFALASLSCPEGHAAVFPNDPQGSWDDGLELSCAENDIGWRKYNPDEPGRLGDLVDPASLPVCVLGASGAAHNGGRLCSLTLAVTLVLCWLLRA
ncbi:hypothetical protein GWK47_027338 [Chionoecetes opilio]|uniref:Ig-like domain-containing protein n=1 Tax=Chionoecetes opilio TaxID=41210 RepID=A0A8J8WMP4_CHIOP|nr:hypothetical protein GWK47_027338 [Chionoecetes opilio]